MWCMKCVVCEVRSLNYEVWSANCEVWTVNFKGYFTLSPKHDYKFEYEVPSMSVKSELWNVNYEVWTIKCEVWTMN